MDKEKLKNRFKSYNFLTNEKGCKLWNNSKTYGKYRMGGKVISAHRAAYILFVGEIPQGKHVCHACDVKSCVNIEHLFIGTHQDNMLDMHKKGRWRTGNFGNHLKLSGAMADIIYDDIRPHQSIADDYGISRTLVSQIKNHKIWAKNRAIPQEQKTRLSEMAARLLQ